MQSSDAIIGIVTRWVRDRIAADPIYIRARSKQQPVRQLADGTSARLDPDLPSKSTLYFIIMLFTSILFEI